MPRVGETRVDLHHLLEDLRDAYGGSIEESIVTEIVANALDAGATSIDLSVDAAAAALTIVDDGRGMLRRELARYHDIAASTKRRGEGIGFAGVGIKLGLLVSRDVVTETRRGTTHVATRWALASRHRAPWKWIPPQGLVVTRGTAVRLVLSNPLSPLVDAGFLEETIRRHFEPLLDAVFEPLLRRHYTRSVAITIEGRQVSPAPRSTADVVPVAVRLARKRLPSATGYLARSGRAALRGSRGHRHQHVRQGHQARLGLAGPLTGGGRSRHGARRSARSGRMSHAQQERLPADGSARRYLSRLSQGAAGSGLAPAHRVGRCTRRVIRTAAAGTLDRDLARVLEDLAGEFPLLHSLVERRRGGQKRLPMPNGPRDGEFGPLFALARAADEPAESEPALSRDAGSVDAPPPVDATEPEPDEPPRPGADTAAPRDRTRRAVAHYGLSPTRGASR
jgi:hypothetical protein